MKLSDTEQRLYNKLCAQREVRISVLYRAVAGRWPEPGMSNRTQQMRVGTYFTRMRSKLKPSKLSIVPGRSRGTYCLVKTDK